MSSMHSVFRNARTLIIFKFTLLFIISSFSGISLGSTFISLHGDMGNQNSGFGLKITHEVPSFKVLVPPGATMVNLRIYCVNDARNMYAVSRFNTPPQNYGAPPSYEEGRGYTLSQLQSDNRFSLNHDGIILISRNYFSQPVSINESGWIYVDIRGGWDVKWINYNINVNGEVYNNWYNTVDWFTDVDTGGVYVPPSNNSPPINTDPPPSNNREDEGDIWGKRPDYNPPPSDGGNNQNPGCTNPFLCGFEDYNPPSTDRDGDYDNPFNPGAPDNGDSSGDDSNQDPPSNDDDGDDQAGIVDPVFSIMCGRNSQKVITAEHLEGRSIGIPQPVMTTDGISESLEYYAMIVVGSMTLMAVNDAIYPDLVSFIEYEPGDRVRSFKRGPLDMSSYWVCDVFGENLYDLEIPVQAMAQHDVHFFCGYAPEGEVGNGYFQNLEYVELWFDPNLK